MVFKICVSILSNHMSENVLEEPSSLLEDDDDDDETQGLSPGYLFLEEGHTDHHLGALL